MLAIQEQQGNLLLKLYIQPKASRDQFIGLHGDELKVAITAPPVDGKANAYLTKFLAKQFKVPKSQVQIVKGLQSRHKQVHIEAPQVIPKPLQPMLNIDT